MKIISLIFGVLFLFCAAVQYNDPDPYRWIAIYGGAAVACIQAAGDRLPWWFSACIGFIAFVWAIHWVGALLGKSIPWADVFGVMEMKSATVEEARELLGLLLVTAWMTILTLHRFRLQKPTRV